MGKSILDKDKNIKVIVAIITVLTIGFGSLALMLSSPEFEPLDDSLSINYHTSVCVYKNGEPIGDCSHNLMTNKGLNWTLAILSQVEVASGNMSIIALGNYSNVTESMTFLNSTASNQAIADCGLSPAAGTVAWVGDRNISISKVFTSSCNNEVVNTTALYNQTANGTALTMFAGKNFTSSVTLQNSDTLNVTWYIWVT